MTKTPNKDNNNDIRNDANHKAKREALLKAWGIAAKVFSYLGKKTAEAIQFLYNEYIPPSIRDSRAIERTGHTLIWLGRAAKKSWHLASCESTKGEYHFSGKRLLTSAVLGTLLATSANIAYVYGTTDTYRNVVVTARDTSAQGENVVAGKIYTKDEDGKTVINKRYFSVDPTILRTSLWHSDQVFKDIPSDALCDFKTYGVYWYSMLTQGVVHRPNIYEANCHSMTYEEKLLAQSAQQQANGNESRVEKLNYGYFDRDYGFFTSKSTATPVTAVPQVPVSQTATLPSNTPGVN